MRWLDPADQARLRGLGLDPRRPCAPSAPGRHRTLARGFTRDFAQHRPYAPGDDARAIDWKAYARLDRYYVREYRAEDRVSLLVILDASASMSFAGKGRSAKFDAARRAAAGLCWLALAQGDEAGLAAIGGGAPVRVPMRAGAGQLGAIDEALSIAQTSGDGKGDLAAELEQASSHLPRRAVVITGRGRGFCAGEDLDEMGQGAAGGFSVRGARRDLVRLQDLTRRILAFPKPVVAAINGPAVGLGAEIPLACRVRIATPQAYFSFAEASRGMLQTNGTFHFLPRLVGLGRAMEWLVTARRIPIEEAFAAGLVNAVVPPGELVDLAVATA